LRGTPQAPLAVEIVPTQTDKEKERREQQREQSKAAEEHELVDATWALVRWTAGLAVVTGLLAFAALYTAQDAKRSARAALDASTKATATLIKVERPYVTGGGYCRDHGPVDGAKQFHVEVQNLGKTPAFLTDYGVEFAKLAELKAELTDRRPARSVRRRFEYDDRLASSEKKEIGLITVEPGADVLFGAFWYLDWSKDREHEFRFVLRIAGDTHPDISRLVHPDYSKWD
jgi:hypothetical protein